MPEACPTTAVRPDLRPAGKEDAVEILAGVESRSYETPAAAFPRQRVPTHTGGRRTADLRTAGEQGVGGKLGPLDARPKCDVRVGNPGPTVATEDPRHGCVRAHFPVRWLVEVGEPVAVPQPAGSRVARRRPRSGPIAGPNAGEAREVRPMAEAVRVRQPGSGRATPPTYVGVGADRCGARPARRLGVPANVPTRGEP